MLTSGYFTANKELVLLWESKYGTATALEMIQEMRDYGGRISHDYAKYLNRCLKGGIQP